MSFLVQAERAQRALRRAAAPPALATPAVMARTATSFFVVIGIMGAVITTVIPGDDSARSVVLYVGAAVSVATGLAVHRFGQRIDVTLHMALILFATIALTFMIERAPNAAAAISMTVLYTCIACHAAFVLSWLRAAAVVAFTLPCVFIGVVLRADLMWWAAVLPATATAMVGVAVAILSRAASDADIDPLTGLLNRRGFDRAFASATAAAASGTDPNLALVLFDLDRFTSTNDRIGARAGDKLLVHVAEQWAELVPRDAVLARYGGDEFALLLPRTPESRALRVADALRAAIAADSSAGVTTWSRGDTASLFVGRADTGLYRAKASGRNRTVVESALRPAIVAELRAAIDSGIVDVHYQSIVDPTTDRINGFEALVRWSSAEQPDLTAAGVVTIAENEGLIADLGRVVLRRACRDAWTLWRALRDDSIVVNVNVSGIELDDTGYAAGVLAVLAENDFPATQLVLEITESEFAADSPKAKAQVQRLRRAGVRIAIDDFGSGYSSLNRLAAMPCDVLKLDRAVIGDAQSAVPMLTAITALGSAFGLEVLVEGIETHEQARMVAGVGITRAQGYLYGRPRTLSEIASATTR